MRRCCLPVETVSAILDELASLDIPSLDIPSLFTTWRAFDVLDANVMFRLINFDEEKVIDAVLAGASPLTLRCAIENGGRLNSKQFVGLLNPYRPELLKEIREVRHTCLTRRANIGWGDAVSSFESEEDFLDFLSYHHNLRKVSMAKEAAAEMVRKGFRRVITHLHVHKFNVPWLHYFSVIEPEKCPNPEEPWELFKKLFLIKDLSQGWRAKAFKGYRLPDYKSDDIVRAAEALLLRAEFVQEIETYERHLERHAVTTLPKLTATILQAKLNLGVPFKYLRLPNSLTWCLVNLLTDDQINQGIICGFFQSVEWEALNVLIRKRSFSVVRNLVIAQIPAVWEMLVESGHLVRNPALFRELQDLLETQNLPTPATTVTLLLPEATSLLRKGQWVYLAAHPYWGRSMTLTYVAVGLGMTDFVDLMLKRMGKGRTFGDTEPFNVRGAIELAQERGHEVMAAHLSLL
jgi:hypothetical protein